jgi:squalene synthase HpnC
MPSSSQAGPPAGSRPRENFLVASPLIRRDLRPLVGAFYDFARAADDIADAPGRTPEDKLAGLDHMERGLRGDPGGAAVARDLHDRLVAADRRAALGHAHRLLDAFRQDARGHRYAGWDDLVAYCDASANPVGRFLLEIHDEPAALAASSDAICTALQVLNHLQDIAFDRTNLGRVYLPADWLDEAGVFPGDLAAGSLTPALRAVIDRCLDRCDALLGIGRELPPRLASRRLAAEVRAILHTGMRLAQRLRDADPLRTHPRPGLVDFAAGVALGLVEGLRPIRTTAARRPA